MDDKFVKPALFLFIREIKIGVPSSSNQNSRTIRLICLEILNHQWSTVQTGISHTTVWLFVSSFQCLWTLQFDYWFHSHFWLFLLCFYCYNELEAPDKTTDKKCYSKWKTYVSMKIQWNQMKERNSWSKFLHNLKHAQNFCK